MKANPKPRGNGAAKYQNSMLRAVLPLPSCKIRDYEGMLKNSVCFFFASALHSFGFLPGMYSHNGLGYQKPQKNCPDITHKHANVQA